VTNKHTNKKKTALTCIICLLITFAFSELTLHVSPVKAQSTSYDFLIQTDGSGNYWAINATDSLPYFNSTDAGNTTRSAKLAMTYTQQRIIEFDAGIFNLTTHIEPEYNLTICGQGMGQTIIQASAELPYNVPMIFGYVGLDNFDNSSFHDFTLDARTYGVTALACMSVSIQNTELTVHNVEFIIANTTAKDQVGLNFWGTGTLGTNNNVTVTNCIFDGGRGYSIGVTNHTGITVTNSYFKGYSIDEDDGLWLVGSSNLTISNNQFYNFTHNAAFLTRCDQCVFRNNTFLIPNFSGSDAIDCNSADTNILIENNYMYRPSAGWLVSCISLEDNCENVTLRNNIFQHSALQCYTTVNITAIGNSFINAGVKLVSCTSSFINNTFSGTFYNILTDSDFALTYVWTDDTYISLSCSSPEYLNGNATLTGASYSDNVISYVLSAPSGTLTSQVYSPLGEPYSVTGASTYSFDSGTNIVTVASSNSTTITLDYNNPNSADKGSLGSSNVSPIQPLNQFKGKPTVAIPVYFYFFVVFLLFILGCLGYVLFFRKKGHKIKFKFKR
jgi:parallel beta-helix repeat protein